MHNITNDRSMQDVDAEVKKKNPVVKWVSFVSVLSNMRSGQLTILASTDIKRTFL